MPAHSLDTMPLKASPPQAGVDCGAFMPNVPERGHKRRTNGTRGQWVPAQCLPELWPIAGAGADAAAEEQAT